MKLVIAALCVLLVACTPSAKLNTADAERMLNEAYVQTIRQQIPWSEIQTDMEIVQQGRDACRLVERSDTSTPEAFAREISLRSLDAGTDIQETGFIIGASIGAYCPEYTYLVE